MHTRQTRSPGYSWRFACAPGAVARQADGRRGHIALRPDSAIVRDEGSLPVPVRVARSASRVN